VDEHRLEKHLGGRLKRGEIDRFEDGQIDPGLGDDPSQAHPNSFDSRVRILPLGSRSAVVERESTGPSNVTSGSFSTNFVLPEITEKVP